MVSYKALNTFLNVVTRNPNVVIWIPDVSVLFPDMFMRLPDKPISFSLFYMFPAVFYSVFARFLYTFPPIKTI